MHVVCSNSSFVRVRLEEKHEMRAAGGRRSARGERHPLKPPSGDAKQTWVLVWAYEPPVMSALWRSHVMIAGAVEAAAPDPKR